MIQDANEGMISHGENNRHLVTNQDVNDPLTTGYPTKSVNENIHMQDSTKDDLQDSLQHMIERNNLRFH